MIFPKNTIEPVQMIALRVLRIHGLPLYTRGDWRVHANSHHASQS